MKEINIAKNLMELRKKKGITQEELAKELHISPQAISKWETATCLPDTQTMPQIADFYNVSIDYLYYGMDLTYSDINERVYNRIWNLNQMSKEAYEEAFNIYSCLHAGISRWANTLKNIKTPNHISSENGVSLFSADGYGCIITRDYFKNINKETLNLCQNIFEVLRDENSLLIVLEIIAMSDISYNELKEKINISDEVLKLTLEKLENSKLVVATKSKHKSLQFTYDINEMYYVSLCIILATGNVLLKGIKNGISCHLGFGDFPINENK